MLEKPKTPSHHHIYERIDETIYNTPLIRLSRLFAGYDTTILGKAEFFNPGGSVKDRIARSMIETAEEEGILTPKTHIIEPTSGNTGIALAMVAAAKGYRITLTMPESMSMERRMLLARFGAQLELTPVAEGMRGAIQKAQALFESSKSAWIPNQFENPANPMIHEMTTGPEIWKDAQGNVDALVAGIGSGGTFTGTTRYLRAQNPNLGAYAVEPAESAVLSGKSPGAHKIQGIGAGFIPANMDVSLISGIETVTGDLAIEWARKAAAVEGLLVGISSGAALAAAERLAKRPEMKGKTIVVILPSCGERYLSTPLFDDLRTP